MRVVARFEATGLCQLLADLLGALDVGAAVDFAGDAGHLARISWIALMTLSALVERRPRPGVLAKRLSPWRVTPARRATSEMLSARSSARIVSVFMLAIVTTLVCAVNRT